mmetsp:Transcript_2855/g.5341  ORF Transcript_2855/g.5341 Transcript_2855/m.5341 type:complete len:94 (+) Transcript_2855:767-1048(+)
MGNHHHVHASNNNHMHSCECIRGADRQQLVITAPFAPPWNSSQCMVYDSTFQEMCKFHWGCSSTSRRRTSQVVMPNLLRECPLDAFFCEIWHS